jgi:predicted Zn-dependent peptidase
MHSHQVHIRTRALLISCALACLVTGHALGWPWSSKVQIGEVHAVRKVCRNGLKAVAIRTTNQTAAVYMVVGAGTRHESPSATGLAHLTEHAMFAGTAAVGPDELDRRVKAMGGRANAYTRYDYTLYYDIGLPPTNLMEVLRLEADRLQNLTFSKEPFLREQKRLEEEEHDTYSISSKLDELVDSVVYRREPSSAPKPPESHTHGPWLSIDQVRQFYLAHYRPDNTAVVVVSPLTERETLRLIENAFAGLKRDSVPPPTPTGMGAETERRKVIPSKLGRDRVEYAWTLPPLGHKHGHTIDVLVQVLHLRGLQRDQVVSIRQDVRSDGGLLRMYATGEKAEQAAGSLLADFFDHPPDRSEVKKARFALRNSFEDLAVHTRPYFSLPAMVGVYEVLGLPRYIEDYRSHINRVSARDLIRVAKTYILPDDRYTIVFQKKEREEIKWPDDPAKLGKVAQEADASGDFDTAIEAYSRLLAMTGSKKYKTIYLATRGQLFVRIRDYDAAIADFEAALEITGYPAIRPLLEEAKMLQQGFAAEMLSDKNPETHAGTGENNQPSDAKETLLAMIPGISKELEEWRGLKFKRPVEVTFSESAAGSLKGMYNTKKAELVIILEDGKPRFSRGVLLHELYHALQDQHFNLLSVRADPDNKDAQRGIDALIEGEAMLAVSELMQYDFRQHTRLPEKGPIKKDRFEKIFNYGAGMSFVESLRKRGSWEAIAAAYKDPPQSTREIYRPELYPAHQARPASFPSPKGKILKKDVIGCYDIYLMLALSESTRAEALNVATRALWAEKYELSESGEKSKTVLYIQFESSKDGKKFIKLLESSPKDFPWGVESRGETIVLTAHPQV